ncbi:hypothetical protein ACFL0A_02020 [Patescibacteria group bacterium]
MEENNKTYPEGHFVGQWMSIGMVVGAPLGLAFSFVFKNYISILVGLTIGMCIGLVIGSRIEAKHKKEGIIRPLTEGEKKRKKIAITALFIILLIGALVGLFVY